MAPNSLLYIILYSYLSTLCSAEQVVNLLPDQTFSCCPSYYFRTDPVMYCYKGRDKHIMHIWETVQLHLNLPSDAFEQFDGLTPADVQKKFEDRKASWYFNLYVTKRKDIRLNPFNSTCVGIVTKSDYAVKLTRIRVDYWRVLMFSIGLVLFFLAPKLSSNSVFYYLCGVSFGLCASILILVFIISKLLPKKPIMYSVMASGWAIGLYVMNFLWDNVRTIAMEYQAYVVYYMVFASVVSFCICYRIGPVSDPRSINLITWFIQGAGMLLILFSSHFQEATLAFNIIMLVFYIMPFKATLMFCKKWFRRLGLGGRPQQKLLTEDEYYQQGVEETRKALEELRGYCSSPECNQWRTMLKLYNPQRYPFQSFSASFTPRNRFAKFVEGSSHLEDNEVLSFELDDAKRHDDDLLTDDSSSDSF